MIIRENSEWLRYVFWCCALGLGLLAVQIATSPDRDTSKIITCILGSILFGFSGFVLKTHKAVFDPHQKKISLTHRGLKNTTQKIIPFSDVTHIVIVKTYHHNEDMLPANRWQECWYLALMCQEEIVTLTHNPAVQKEEVYRLSQKIQSILGVDILDSDQASLNALLKTGRKVDAITLATRSLGMNITEASQYIDSLR